jgi:hypothetical protein
MNSHWKGMGIELKSYSRRALYLRIHAQYSSTVSFLTFSSFQNTWNALSGSSRTIPFQLIRFSFNNMFPIKYTRQVVI